MTEPKPRSQYAVTRGEVAPPAGRLAVEVILPLDWAQAVTRLQQLHNTGYTVIRIRVDERGRVRIEPND